MKETIISRQNEGTKLFRILVKLLPCAEKNFLYKMLRKKNITLNDKKADGSEILMAGDSIKIFFSDETYERFAGSTGSSDDADKYREIIKCGQEAGRNKNNSFTKITPDKVIYEDDDVILCNKPAGVLSQKAAPEDMSMVEYIAEYLENKGEYVPGDSIGFKPAVSNRLDRNTSGMIAAGKTVSGLKFLSEGFKKGQFEKVYLCIVRGEVKDAVMLKGLWEKSSHGNKVVIRDAGPVKGYTKSAEGYAESAEGYTKSAEGYTKSAEGYAESAEGYAKSAEGYAKSAEGYAESAEGYAESAEGYAKSAEGYAEPVEGYAEPVEGYAKSAEGYAKSAEGYAEPVEAYHTNSGKTDDTILPPELFKKGNVPVLTFVQPVKSNGKATFCIVRLLTGKTHQIRAHLSAVGHPLLGDHKYGDRAFNGYYKDLYGTEFQLLHAYCLKIPEKGVFFADIPQLFEKLLKGEDLWEHGIQEVCVDLLSRI